MSSAHSGRFYIVSLRSGLYTRIIIYKKNRFPSKLKWQKKTDCVGNNVLIVKIHDGKLNNSYTY